MAFVLRKATTYAMTGDDIKAMRTRHGWTQHQLAGRLGISQVRVSQLETGDRISRVMELALIALDRLQVDAGGNG